MEKCVVSVVVPVFRCTTIAVVCYLQVAPIHQETPEHTLYGRGIEGRLLVLDVNAYTK
jgi:hypothetical protein